MFLWSNLSQMTLAVVSDEVNKVILQLKIKLAVRNRRPSHRFLQASIHPYNQH